MSEIIQEHKISLTLVSGEVLDVSLWDDNVSDRIEQEMLNQKFKAAVESVEVEHVEHRVPKGSVYLDGWFAVPELQSIIVQITAGLRGVDATTIQFPEYILIIASEDGNNKSVVSDITVWEKERWDTFKALVDLHELWPMTLNINPGYSVVFENGNDVRKYMQSAALEELGPVFFDISTELPTGTIIEKVWKLFTEYAEEPEGSFGDDEGTP